MIIRSIFRAHWRLLEALAFGSLALIHSASCDFPSAANAGAGEQDFQTTRFRYVNLTRSRTPQILSASSRLYNAATRETYFDSVVSAPVAYGGKSDFQTPLADSAALTVREIGDGGIFFQPALPLTFFLRNATYTVIGLPFNLNNKRLDTILVATALPADIPAGSVNVRFINCVNDSTQSFSFALGCPSGLALGGALPYRGNSGYIAVPLSGNELSFSLLQRVVGSGANSSAGIYRVRPLAAQGSYTILLYKTPSDSLKLLALNDSSDETLSVESAELPQTFVRVANFTAAAVPSVVYASGAGGQTISENLASFALSPFRPLGACGSIGKDTVRIRRAAGGATYILSTSFEPNASQTIFIGDSAVLSVAALPAQAMHNGVALRVVNLSSQNITLFRGATTFARSYSLVNNLARGAISPPATLPAEELHPLLLFSAGSPPVLKQSGVETMNEAKAYFLVVTDKSMALIPDVQTFDQQTPPLQPTPIEPIAKGIVVQAVHVFADATTASVNMTLGRVVKNAPVGYGAPLLTALPANAGGFDIAISTATQRFVNASSDARYLIVGIGSENNRRVIVARGMATPENPLLTPTPGVQSSLRYLNAAPDVPALRVDADEAGSFQAATPFAFGSFSAIDRFYRNQTRTLIFQGSPALDTVFIARNLSFTLGRGYTVVLSGERSRNSYNAIVIPEF
jgi:hypothetical protein